MSANEHREIQIAADNRNRTKEVGLGNTRNKCSSLEEVRLALVFYFDFRVNSSSRSVSPLRSWTHCSICALSAVRSSWLSDKCVRSAQSRLIVSLTVQMSCSSISFSVILSLYLSWPVLSPIALSDTMINLCWNVLAKCAVGRAPASRC